LNGTEENSFAREAHDLDDQYGGTVVHRTTKTAALTVVNSSL